MRAFSLFHIFLDFLLVNCDFYHPTQGETPFPVFGSASQKRFSEHLTDLFGSALFEVVVLAVVDFDRPPNHLVKQIQDYLLGLVPEIQPSVSFEYLGFPFDGLLLIQQGQFRQNDRLVEPFGSGGQGRVVFLSQIVMPLHIVLLLNGFENVLLDWIYLLGDATASEVRQYLQLIHLSLLTLLHHPKRKSKRFIPRTFLRIQSLQEGLGGWRNHSDYKIKQGLLNLLICGLIFPRIRLLGGEGEERRGRRIIGIRRGESLRVFVFSHVNKI